MNDECPLIVLAGGFGTRLSAVVKDVPKPLAPVAGKPFLYYLILAWRKQGIRKFVFLVYFKADVMEEFILAEKKDGILQGCDVDIILEKEALGTGGAVANAVQLLNVQGSFLVANADTYMESGIMDLVMTDAPAIATVSVPNAGRYGSIKTASGKVLSFEEKNPEAGRGEINAGLYHLEAEMFEDWNGLPFSMEKDVFEKQVTNHNLHAVSVNSVFIDIGIPEDYQRFCNWIASGKKIEL